MQKVFLMGFPDFVHPAWFRAARSGLERLAGQGLSGRLWGGPGKGPEGFQALCGRAGTGRLVSIWRPSWVWGHFSPDFVHFVRFVRSWPWAGVSGAWAGKTLISADFWSDLPKLVGVGAQRGFVHLFRTYLCLNAM